MRPSYETLPWLGTALLLGVMFLLWNRQRRGHAAGIVDLAWTLGVAGLMGLYAALGPGWGPRRFLVGALAAAWGGRLTLHIAVRLRREAEDGRYAAMKAEKGEDWNAFALGFFAIQALLAGALSLVAFVPARVALPRFETLELAALTLFAFSVAGETIADRQLEAWRSNPSNKGRTCRSGLWRFSRHPNYFCEWLVWVAWALLATPHPGGAWVWLAPLVMWLLVTRVTGIPPAEQQSLRSRGDDYRAYQRETNAFFPGPPRLGDSLT